MHQDNQILVACDVEETLNLMVSRLDDGGYRSVHLARSAQEALALLDAHAIRCLVTTMDLSDLDGWRLARLVRCGALNCNASMPIIVLTDVWSQRIAEVTAREYGVNRLLAYSDVSAIAEEVGKCLSDRPSKFNKPRLLVIEDAADTADLIRRVLDRQYRIDVVDNGEDGIQLWKQYRHSLVLLDYMLPNMSGEEILKIILAINAEQAVVLMTAHSSRNLAEKIMLLGATDFLPKPFRTEQLRHVCELAVRREDFMLSNRQFSDQVKYLEKSEREYRNISEKHQQLLHNLQTVVMELDDELNITYLNYPWKVLMGYDIQASIGKSICDYLPTENREDYVALQKKLCSVLTGEILSYELELCLLDDSGQRLWAQMKVRRVIHSDISSLTICLDNITKRKQAQEELEYIAMHDALTGLFNRHYFEESLKHLYADTLRSKRQHGLLYIDLDHFKVINDTFGHREGDNVLREISKSMSRRVRASDMLCRIGGDEYAVLVHDIDEQGLYDIAKDIQKIVNDYTYHGENHQVNMGCSIGVSLMDGKLGCAEEYLMQADIALYVAKGRGRNIVHTYDLRDNESEELRSRINWAQRVRQAIASNRVVLHFQPVFDVKKEEYGYYEALVRLIDENGALIYPEKFISALEQTGEMHLLDRWVIKLAVEQLRKTPSLRKIAINLSAQAFNDDNLVPVIKESLSANLVDPSAITFELTESASLFNLNVTTRVIDQLHDIGCSFAIDDFGSGFSSFSYLKELPADFIKLDGSFVCRLHVDDVDKALVKSLIQVVKALGKKAVAEYVENEEVMKLLVEYGIDYVQGNYIGKALAVDDVLASYMTYDSRNDNLDVMGVLPR
ncbi:two-component system response regulator [Teredinibacter purpureus]|uniref:two-component system response regulator n=1 Tax=Teredinibacter purpureus TaxID=2731756 RepID=UPI0005F7F12F|nr:EAL domain-containing protein [Teredinibacter purpureus]